MSYRALFFKPSIASEAFWQGCNEGKFLLQRCGACGKAGYYPRMFCMACGSGDLQYVEASGSGTIYTFTHVYLSFHGADWNDQLPYTPVLVDLDEGVRITSRLVGEGRQDVAIGDRVEISFVVVDGQSLPFVRRAGPPAGG